MNTWHNDMGRISTIRDVRHKVSVSQEFDTFVAAPPITMDRCSFSHTIQNEFMNTCRRYIWDDRHSNSASTTPPNFCSDCNDRLSFSSATANLLSNTANIGFINFNGAGQLVATWANHHSAKLVKPVPSSIITAKTKNPLQPKSTCAMFLTCHKPHGEKPCSKWFVNSMKQCSSSNGSLSFTFPTKKEASPHRRWFLCGKSATGANETFWPPNFRNIVKARGFSIKPFIKFLKRSRIINARNGVSLFLHHHILHHVVG